jgi:hypothetical protein
VFSGSPPVSTPFATAFNLFQYCPTRENTSWTSPADAKNCENC